MRSPGPRLAEPGRETARTGGLASWRTGSSGAATPGGGPTVDFGTAPDAMRPGRASLGSYRCCGRTPRAGQAGTLGAVDGRRCRSVRAYRRAFVIELNLDGAVATGARQGRNPAVGRARSPLNKPHEARHAINGKRPAQG